MACILCKIMPVGTNLYFFIIAFLYLSLFLRPKCQTQEKKGTKMIFPYGMDILPPFDDHIFKTMLTHPEAPPVLADLISSAIMRRVLSTQVRNTELPSMDVDEKDEHLDVNCVTDNGDQVDVEMHGSRIVEIFKGNINFINKYIYYLTDLHSSQKSKGIEYYNLVLTYQLTFCTYSIFPDKTDFINRFSLRRENGEELSYQINMVIIELSKLKQIMNKPADKLTPLEMWSVFLRYAPDEQHRKYINQITSHKEEIAMAANLLMEISKDERERAIQRSRRMYETDQISNLLTAEARGEARGLEKGLAQGMAQGIDSTLAVIKGINNNVPLERIALEAGLSMDEVLKIKSGLA